MVLEEFYQSTTELVPDEMNMKTDTELPQYFIQSWKLTYMSQGRLVETCKLLIGAVLGKSSIVFCQKKPMMIPLKIGLKIKIKIFGDFQCKQITLVLMSKIKFTNLD